MKKRTVLLVVSCLIAAILLLVSCAPAAVEKEEAEVTPGEEEVVVTGEEEEAAPPAEEEEVTPPPEEEEEAAPPPSKPHFTSDDGRIEFTLDNVERTKVWPAELRNGHTPEEGHDFIIVDVTIVRITDGHVQGRRGSAIVGNDGVEYQEVSSIWKGVEFKDPRSLTASYELIEGATGKFVFGLPEEIQPTRLRLAYLFFESWSESWKPEGEEERYIDIILS